MKILKDKEKSKLSDEWATPHALYQVLDDEFHFELDVCASATNFKCKHYYTIKDNGLSLYWLKPYFCNPPYSNILPWARSGAYVAEAPVGVHLVKYDPSTKHGRIYAENADELRIIEHRLKFVGANASCNFPCAIAVFRKRLYTKKSWARVLYVNYKDVIEDYK